MRILPRNIFIQNLDSQLLRENFLISSVATILVIRFFLKVTDYPQLSGAGLHIAHLLWGGFFMLAALLLVFSFLSKSSSNTASVLGGIGFGAFIDELGKFITSDNNYFFQPTVAILYVLFILLYIFSKLLSEKQKVTKEEYLVNAVDILKETVINDLDEQEKKQALAYLKKSDPKNPLVILLQKYLHDMETSSGYGQSVFSLIRKKISAWYSQATRSRLLGKSVIFLLLAQTVGTVIWSLFILYDRTTLTFGETGQAVSSLFSGLFVLLGAFTLARDRIQAYRLFKTSVLIALFLTQFFLFYQQQFLALIGLAVNVILLEVIEYALAQETRKIED